MLKSLLKKLLPAVEPAPAESPRMVEPVIAQTDDLLEGIPVVDADGVLAELTHEMDYLKRIASVGSGGSGFDFDALYLECIKNLVAYVHLLPASEGFHHGYRGGLIKHSLDVAVKALRVARQQHLRHEFAPDQERHRLPRWRYAAFLGGLVHDLGKVVSDLDVIDYANRGNQWTPLVESIYEWQQRTDVNRYLCKWRASRVHHSHEKLNQAMLKSVIPDAGLRFLSESPDPLFVNLCLALSNYRRSDGYLQNSIRIADHMSTGDDIRIIWDKELGPRKAQLFELISKAVQSCALDWCNDPASDMVIIGSELYLRWPSAFESIVDRFDQFKIDAPKDIEILRSRLVERNLVYLYDNVNAHFFPNIRTREEALELLSDDSALRRGFLAINRVEWPQFALGRLPMPDDRNGLIKPGISKDALLYTDGEVLSISESDVQLYQQQKKASSQPTPANQSAPVQQSIPLPTQESGPSPSQASSPPPRKESHPTQSQPMTPDRLKLGAPNQAEPQANALGGFESWLKLNEDRLILLGDDQSHYIDVVTSKSILGSAQYQQLINDLSTVGALDVDTAVITLMASEYQQGKRRGQGIKIKAAWYEAMAAIGTTEKDQAHHHMEVAVARVLTALKLDRETVAADKRRNLDVFELGLIFIDEREHVWVNPDLLSRQEITSAMELAKSNDRIRKVTREQQPYLVFVA